MQDIGIDASKPDIQPARERQEGAISVPKVKGGLKEFWERVTQRKAARLSAEGQHETALQTLANVTVEPAEPANEKLPIVFPPQRIDVPPSADYGLTPFTVYYEGTSSETPGEKSHFNQAFRVAAQRIRYIGKDPNERLVMLMFDENEGLAWSADANNDFYIGRAITERNGQLRDHSGLHAEITRNQSIGIYARNRDQVTRFFRFIQANTSWDIYEKSYYAIGIGKPGATDEHVEGYFQEIIREHQEWDIRKEVTPSQ